MGKNCYNLVMITLLVLGTGRTSAIPNYCNSCEPGSFCSKDPQICKKCPSSTYSTTYGRPYCELCRVCEGYFRYKKPCTPTSNAECDCAEGFHCWGVDCEVCEEDCKPGQELTEQGCKSCGFGMFNDQNASGTCRPWTNCSLNGKSVLKNGTEKSDVVCGPSLVSLPPGERSVNVLTLFLALTTAVLLFLLVVIFGLSMARWIRKKSPYVFKQPLKMAVQMAQEEDACSCRFPQEEEGGSYEL